MGSINKSDSILLENLLRREGEKKQYFRLHLLHDLCIIMPRPAPRWAKWSRGVRTRGLRVGLVGGPRPLYFLGLVFPEPTLSSASCFDNIAPLDFPGKWHNIRTTMKSNLFVLE